jgi:hypothetical protein
MKRIPDQLVRLSIPFLLLVVALVAAKWLLTPATFGQLGHYRAAALGDNASREIQFMGQQACADCHSDVVTTKTRSYHKGVSCEVCHGAARAHVESPGDQKPPAPRERGLCPLCHSFNPSRPTGFPQIIPTTHNPGKACISCHNPHDPTPPRVPRECVACHAVIERAKLVSSHVNVPCTTCHQTPDRHKVEPRVVRPNKPTSREFCGGCHAKDATSPKEIPRIELATHGGRYVCWECHYPHLPKPYSGARR